MVVRTKLAPGVRRAKFCLPRNPKTRFFPRRPRPGPRRIGRRTSRRNVKMENRDLEFSLFPLIFVVQKGRGPRPGLSLFFRSAFLPRQSLGLKIQSADLAFQSQGPKFWSQGQNFQSQGQAFRTLGPNFWPQGQLCQKVKNVNVPRAPNPVPNEASGARERFPAPDVLALFSHVRVVSAPRASVRFRGRDHGRGGGRVGGP